MENERGYKERPIFDEQRREREVKNESVGEGVVEQERVQNRGEGKEEWSCCQETNVRVCVFGRIVRI